MKNIILKDRYNRNINYFRISVTDRCNLSCIYCNPRKNIQKLKHSDILSYEEILRLAQISVNLGISKIRITGGEPLFRKGVYTFLQKLSDINGLSDISLTTNGIFLKENLKKIKSACIKRINISMDTLNREKYKIITGHDMLCQVKDGIKAAHDMGFSPIKINIVLLKEINDDEIIDFAKLSISHPFHIRFIEYMPMGNTSFASGNWHISFHEIKKRLLKLGKLIPVANDIYSGPAKRYKFQNAKGEIGLINPLSHNFCNECNRLRLTADGRLKSCLLSNKFQDVKKYLRAGCSDAKLASLFLDCINSKPNRHCLSDNPHSNIDDQMYTIGG